MKRFDDVQVTCPFDPKHKMPKQRLQWHFVKCKAKKEREAQGLPIFNCKHYWLHVFFDKEELQSHENDCDYAVKETITPTTSWKSPAPSKVKGWGHEFKEQ